MKSVLIIIAFLLIIVSCKKGSDETIVPANTWQHDTVSNIATSSTRYQSGNYSVVTFSQNASLNAPTLSFSFFNNLPALGGDFIITGGPQATNEISIIALNGFRPAYSSLSMGAVCHVSVNADSKISLLATHIPMKELLFVGGDTAYYSFNLTEF